MTLIASMRSTRKLRNSAQFAPAAQQAHAFKVANHHRPDGARGEVILQIFVAQADLAALMDRGESAADGFRTRLRPGGDQQRLVIDTLRKMRRNLRTLASAWRAADLSSSSVCRVTQLSPSTSASISCRENISGGKWPSISAKPTPALPSISRPAAAN